MVYKDVLALVTSYHRNLVPLYVGAARGFQWGLAAFNLTASQDAQTNGGRSASDLSAAVAQVGEPACDHTCWDAKAGPLRMSLCTEP
jgi:hypothetical protein